MEQQGNGVPLDFLEYRLKDKLKAHGICYRQDDNGKFKVWWRRGKIYAEPAEPNRILPFKPKETLKN